MVTAVDVGARKVTLASGGVLPTTVSCSLRNQSSCTTRCPVWKSRTARTGVSRLEAGAQDRGPGAKQLDMKDGGLRWPYPRPYCTVAPPAPTRRVCLVAPVLQKPS